MLLVFFGGDENGNETGYSTDHSKYLITFVVSGHIAILSSATRAPVGCVRTSLGSTGQRQAHQLRVSNNNQYIIVSNQNGKLLERVNVNFAANSYVLDPLATLNLATCTTPTGAACQDPVLRPDNAPICAVAYESDPNVMFVTLRGGGLFVVDISRTPMRILAEYDRTVFKARIFLLLISIFFFF
jgi:hypothetical protein